MMLRQSRQTVLLDLVSQVPDRGLDPLLPEQCLGVTDLHLIGLRVDLRYLEPLQFPEFRPCFPSSSVSLPETVNSL
jgi:hypothetical protein